MEVTGWSVWVIMFSLIPACFILACKACGHRAPKPCDWHRTRQHKCIINQNKNLLPEQPMSSLSFAMQQLWPHSNRVLQSCAPLIPLISLIQFHHYSIPPPAPHLNVQGGGMRIPIFSGKGGVFWPFVSGRFSQVKNLKRGCF